MEIPKDLANLDSHIVEVFLAGLVPYDDEYEWNARAIDDALNWFPDRNMPNSFVLGTVRTQNFSNHQQKVIKKIF